MDRPGDRSRSTWFVEAVTPGLLQLSSVIATVYAGHTRYQQVEVLETEPFGRILVLDGKTQSSAADEHIYHEALVHPALLAHPEPRMVFIGGGGEGATLREVLAHRTVEQAVMVDLDAEVVALCRQHLPQWHRGAFDDPRVELRHEDAYAYLARGGERFDVLVLDLVDPTEAGPAHRLYTQEFYRLAASRLTAQGTLVVQAGPAIAGVTNGAQSPDAAADSTSALSSSAEFTLSEASGLRTGLSQERALADTARSFPAIARTLRTLFPTVACYSATVPAFGGPWGFVLASKGVEDPAQWTPAEVDRRIAARLASEPRYYDGVTHQGMFSLPKPLRQALAQETWVITEKTPLYVP